MENCGDITEGECIVLCRDSVHASLGKGQEGINKLVALDDWAVWTATGASDIRRWRDPGRRSSRMSRDNMSQWDHSAQSSNRETFGFFRAPSLSRSSTPIAHAISPNPHQSQTSSFMIKVDHSQPSPRFDSPTTISPTSTAFPASSRKQLRHSFQSAVGSDIIIPDESYSNAAEHTLFGIPFDSLVRLASPNQGYPFVGGLMPAHDPDVATLYSAASVLSVPLYHRSAPGSQSIPQPPHPPQNPFHTFIRSASTTTFHASGPHGSVTLNSPDPQPDVPSPQIAYEARELAVDALPLRTQPEAILHGSHGLVRSLILNDRIHALTVDTAGEVAIWDLVRGLYRGYFSSEDVDSASREGSSAHHSHGGSVDRSPRESLETVRERIEGEAMIASWATVDTKMGSLTVHLSEASCFDAEVYADEAGFTNADGFQEEHRRKYPMVRVVTIEAYRNSYDYSEPGKMGPV
jgi:WD repeat-containing protein 48